MALGTVPRMIDWLAARLRRSDTSKSEEAWCRLGRSNLRSELASAERMVLGMYHRLVELTGLNRARGLQSSLNIYI